MSNLSERYCKNCQHFNLHAPHPDKSMGTYKCMANKGFYTWANNTIPQCRYYKEKK